MAEINLLKNELQEKGSLGGGSSRKAKQVLYAVMGILVLEIVIYGFFLIFEKQTAKKVLETERQAAAADFEIGKIDKERREALSLQARLGNLQTLLKNHLYWSIVFAELEKFTYKQAFYESLQVDEETHKFRFSGVVPTYTDLAKLMLGLMKSPNVTSVRLLSSALEEGTVAGYSFNMEIAFDPKLLLK